MNNHPANIVILATLGLLITAYCFFGIPGVLGAVVIAFLMRNI